MISGQWIAFAISMLNFNIFLILDGEFLFLCCVNSAAVLPISGLHMIRREWDVNWNDPIYLTDLPFALLLPLINLTLLYGTGD